MVRQKTKKPKLSREERLFRRGLFTSLLVIGLLGISYQIFTTRPAQATADPVERAAREDVLRDFNQLSPTLREFEDTQARTNVHVVSDFDIQTYVSRIFYLVENGDVRGARAALAELSTNLKHWQSLLGNASIPSPEAAAAGWNVPIILYHYTPPDFAAQLQFLRERGYTTITPHELAAALHSQSGLPNKPVILTFDDGFSDQTKAYQLLRQYNMRATFYIIMGGEASNWCIGVYRRNLNCGDSYFTPDQIRELDQSGVIDIESHSMDHLHLPSLSLDQQYFQIAEAKRQLEALLGHPVNSFAYPFGSFSPETARIVQQVGFESAVTTIPGSWQKFDNLYTLYRIREVWNLP